MMGNNPWERDGRAKKIARYIAAFNTTVTTNSIKDPSPEQAREVLRQIEGATAEQWKMLQQQLGEKHPASPATKEGIAAHFAAIANSVHSDRPPDDQEPGRERYATSGDYVEGGSYRITAVHDGRGFLWSLEVAGKFLRSGFTPGLLVETAFAVARLCAERFLRGEDYL